MENKKRQNFFRKVAVSLSVTAVLGLLSFSTGCSNKDSIAQQSNSVDFVENYNPQNLDVLWVVDSRSPLFATRDHLVSEATAFFKRVDDVTTQNELIYQMGITTSDMLVNRGALKGSPAILKNNIGTSDQRAQTFANSLSSTFINLNTSGINEGFSAALTSLQGAFAPRAGVPLVLIFVSDSDDHSSTSDGSDPVTYFSNQFLALKGNQADLLRVYSINYIPLTSPDSDPSERCATEYNADIDLAPKDAQGNPIYRMNELVAKVGGQTADLCGDFANQIDLSGLSESKPQTSFHLDSNPVPSSIGVTVSSGSSVVPGQDWTFDPTTNNIVFKAPPPQGARIHVTFHT